MTMLAVSQDMAAFEYLHRGIALLRAKNFREAILNFDACLSQTPDDPTAHWDRAIAKLCSGEYATFYEDFRHHQRFAYHIPLPPLWIGQPLAGRSVLILPEAGHGDNILLSRFLPSLIYHGASVTVVADPSLSSLFRCLDVAIVNQIPSRPKDWDYYSLPFSLLPQFAKSPEEVPGSAIRIDAPKPEPDLLGVCWSGKSQRHFSPEAFVGAIQTKGFRVQALQPGPVPIGVVPLPDGDFLDTALVAMRCRHIVTVDTAVANLAGSIGHSSVRVILPFFRDWRWYNAERWFTGVTTYEQEREGGDWNAPFAALNRDIGDVR